MARLFTDVLSSQTVIRQISTRALTRPAHLRLFVMNQHAKANIAYRVRWVPKTNGNSRHEWPTNHHPISDRNLLRCSALRCLVLRWAGWAVLGGFGTGKFYAADCCSCQSDAVRMFFWFACTPALTVVARSKVDGGVVFRSDQRRPCFPSRSERAWRGHTRIE